MRGWLAGYGADSASALVRSGRADFGGRRIATELVQLIENLVLRRPAPQIAPEHRRVAEVAEPRGLPVPPHTAGRRVIHRRSRKTWLAGHYPNSRAQASPWQPQHSAVSRPRHGPF